MCNLNAVLIWVGRLIMDLAEYKIITIGQGLNSEG